MMRRLLLLLILFAVHSQLIAAPQEPLPATPSITVPPITGQAPIDMLPNARPLSAMPGEARLVSFAYDPNETYTILCMPNAVTHIELRKDERLSALAIGDGTQWHAQKKDNHLFLRPLRDGLFTSATLVTTERIYQLTLRSSPPAGKWYQRVAWQYPDILIFEENQAAIDFARAKSTVADDSRPVRATPASLHTVASISVDKLNFTYEIVGDTPFRPAQVFDDGIFTYIRFSARPQEMPALFIKNQDTFALAVYTFDAEGLTIKVHRLFKTAVLKLGNDEIQITYKGAVR